MESRTSIAKHANVKAGGWRGGNAVLRGRSVVDGQVFSFNRIPIPVGFGSKSWESRVPRDSVGGVDQRRSASGVEATASI